MEELETGRDRIQQICDILKKETVEPAKQEARELLENANIQAKEIIEKARKEAETMAQEIQIRLEKKSQIVEGAIRLACRQALESLKEKIFHQLFNPTLSQLIAEGTKDEAVIASIITAVVEAIEDKGIDVDLSAYIPKKVDAKRVNKLLGSQILDDLRENTVLLENFEGGARIQLRDQKITLDISDEAIRDIVADYIREDFRHYLFEEE